MNLEDNEKLNIYKPLGALADMSKNPQTKQRGNIDHSSSLDSNPACAFPALAVLGLLLEAA